MCIRRKYLQIPLSKFINVRLQKLPRIIGCDQYFVYNEIYINTHIYIYICVCVCVCVCARAQCNSILLSIFSYLRDDHDNIPNKCRTKSDTLNMKRCWKNIT